MMVHLPLASFIKPHCSNPASYSKQTEETTSLRMTIPVYTKE
jgi:hypothetical protein